MPYRVNLSKANEDALDRLVDLGALDVELFGRLGGIAALMPDGVTPEQLTQRARRRRHRGLSRRWTGRRTRSGSSSPRADSHRTRSTSCRLTADAEPGALRLIDAPAFGTGLHPTTALCLEALDEAVRVLAHRMPCSTWEPGSGVLALAALMLGVPRALAIDIDDEALRVAAENARLNAARANALQLARGGPETIDRHVAAGARQRAGGPAHRDGAGARAARRPSWSAGALGNSCRRSNRTVERAYRHLGMRRVRAMSRAGWVALELQASW